MVERGMVTNARGLWGLKAQTQFWALESLGGTGGTSDHPNDVPGTDGEATRACFGSGAE